jgi:hypothetical protein
MRKYAFYLKPCYPFLQLPNLAQILEHEASILNTQMGSTVAGWKMVAKDIKEVQRVSGKLHNFFTLSLTTLALR